MTIEQQDVERLRAILLTHHPGTIWRPAGAEGGELTCACGERLATLRRDYLLAEVRAVLTEHIVALVCSASSGEGGR